VIEAKRTMKKIQLWKKTNLNFDKWQTSVWRSFQQFSEWSELNVKSRSVIADRIIGQPSWVRPRLGHSLDLIYFIKAIKFIRRRLHESSCSRSVQEWNIILGEYHCLFIVMYFLYTIKVIKTILPMSVVCRES